MNYSDKWKIAKNNNVGAMIQNCHREISLFMHIMEIEVVCKTENRYVWWTLLPLPGSGKIP